MAEGSEGESPRRCPECGSSKLVRDYTQARLMCRSCGYVIEEGIKDLGPEWRSFNQEQKEDRSRAGPPITPTKHDRGLSTDISRSNRDAKGNLLSPEQSAKLGRLRRWHYRSRFDKDHSRTLRNALFCISRVCSQIGLSSNVKERASYIYREAGEADVVRGRPAEVVAAAAVYMASVEVGLPVSLERVAEAAGIAEKEAQRAHRIVVQELGIGSPPVSPVKQVPAAVRGVESATGRDLPRGVESGAREIAREAEERRLVQGRPREVVAAAAVLLAAEYGSCDIPARMVAGSLGVSHSAVQKAVDDIGRGIGHDALAEIAGGSEGGGDRG